MQQLQQPQQPKGWWERNWKWLVPAGCLTIILAFGAFVALIIFAVFGSLKLSAVYKEALARAAASEEVRAVLGSPVEAGFLVSGQIKTSGPSGSADLSFPISGPKGSATVYAVAHRRAGRWNFSTLEVEVEGSATHINLLAQPPPQ